MAAIILSGGNNRRIGRDKAFLEVDHRTIIEREIEVLSRVFSRIIVVTNSPAKYAHLDVDLASDIVPGKGPLGGIYTGLTVSGDRCNFVVGCDLPFLNAGLIDYMKGLIDQYDVIVPKIGHFMETLYAFYSRECLESIEELIEKGDLRIRSFFNEVRVRHIDKSEIDKFDPEGIAFFNVNTEEKLASARIVAGGVVGLGNRIR